MSEQAAGLGWGVIILTGLCFIIAAITYGCDASDTRYRGVQRACIEKGSSWIAHRSGDHCVARDVRS